MSRSAQRVAGVPVGRIDAAGGIACLDVGSGPVVLLVPGYTGSKEDFGPLLAPIAAAGFRAVAIDLPGQFQSPGSPDPAGYSPDALAAVVLRVVARLGAGPVHLVGHSFGGLVCRAAVLASPGSVASLVLMDSGPGALPGQRASVVTALRQVLLEQGLPALWDLVEAGGGGTRFGRERFLAQHPVALREMGEALLVEPDRTEDLRDLCAAHDIPLLVLWGADDDAWPPALQAQMAARLGAGTREIPGSAHSPAVEAPGPTADALLGFWPRHDAPR